ncbi:MAG: tail fiber domain-containing protein [Acidobacteria bacterium]|nr:tail fiber domain-containing protein [Acidobacteriota bacterium]
MQGRQRIASTLAIAVLLVASAATAAETSRIADVTNHVDGVAFSTASRGALTLTVTGPEGFVAREELTAGAEAFFDTTGLADGFYRWELRTQPVLDAATKAALAKARATGDQSIVQRLRAAGKLPAGDVQSGGFTIQGGAVADDSLIEEAAPEGARADPTGDGLQATGDAALSNVADASQTINTDLIVIGSECVGMDCTSSESFGFDTLRLKENNLRIKFQDTSNSGSFPSRDWQITANDTTNGGANKFSIDDIDGGRTPFTIEAGAPTNSLYVDDGGRVGFGTMAPVVELHIVDGDSPTVRLEQDGSSGFTPQTWDMAGNETNFFVRDVTNGSKLPFKIFPNAKTDLLTVNANGRVGVGTKSPDGTLGVLTSDANSAPAVYVKSTATSSAQDMLQLEVTSDLNLRTNFSGNTGGTAWQWRQTYRASQYNLELNNGGQLTLFDNGNLTITGTYSPSSDRNKKENISDVQPEDILERLARIPVQKWNYIHDQGDTPHLGPMAQDFYAAFGLGDDDKHIATTDADGVAFAAIQALYQRLLEREAQLDALVARNKALEDRLDAIEAMEP